MSRKGKERLEDDDGILEQRKLGIQIAKTLELMQLSAEMRFSRFFISRPLEIYDRHRLLIQRRRAGQTVFSIHDYNTLELIPGSPPERVLHRILADAHPAVPPGNFEVICSCRGIFCLADRNGDDDPGISTIMLWNPQNNQIRVLPPSTIDLDMYNGFTSTVERIGLGCDTRRNDFKVVRTLLGMKDLTEVYSSRRNRWRKLKNGGAIDHAHYIRSIIPERDDRFCYWAEKSDNGDTRVCWFDTHFDRFHHKVYARRSGLPLNASMESISLVAYICLISYSEPRLVDPYVPNDLGIWALTDFPTRSVPFDKLHRIRRNATMGCLQPVECLHSRCLVQRQNDNQLISLDYYTEDPSPPQFHIEGDWQSFKIFPYLPSGDHLA
ncbi:hypothetical protein LINGRAHAP2_LOCUS26645 [Linum grandiflorum]